MLYSLKKVLLNEAIITQQNFIRGLVDIIKNRPGAAGVRGCSSYDSIVDLIKKSVENNQRKVRDTIEIDGLELSEEEARFYSELKSQFDEKEKSRLKTIEIKRSKNISLSKKDQTPIKFNSGIFFKKWSEQRALLQTEGVICAEIVKIVEFFDVITEKDKRQRKNLEQVVIDQIRKYKNIDGSAIEIRGILPLYDSMLKFIKEKADVNINDCIMAADLYMKDLYKIANEETISQMELGNVDFSKVFSKTKFYEEFMQEFILNQKNLLIYEDENIKITYPTGNFSFNQTIKKHKRSDVTWCTKMLSSWIDHTFAKEEYVCIMNVKSVPVKDKDYIISLKVKPDGSIDYKATCDANNIHMGKNRLSKYLPENVLEEIENKTNSILRNIVYDKEKDIKEVIRISGNLAKSGMFFAIQTLILTFMYSESFSNDQENLLRIFKNIYINTKPEARKDFFKLMITTISETYFSNEEFDSEEMMQFFDLDAIGSIKIDKNNTEDKKVKKINLDQSLFVTSFVEILKNRSTGFAGVMYYKAFNDLVDSNIRNSISEDNLLEMFEVSLNTENPEYFSTAMTYMFKTEYGERHLTRKEIEKPDHSTQLKIIEDIVVKSRGFKSLILKPGNNDFKNIIEDARTANSLYNRDSPTTRKACFLASLVFKNIEKTVNTINLENDENQKINIEDIVYKTIGAMLVEDNDLITNYLLKGNEKELSLNLELKKGNNNFLDQKYFSNEKYLHICKNIFEDDSYLRKIKQVDNNIHEDILFYLVQNIATRTKNRSNSISEDNKAKVKKFFSHLLENVSTSSSELKDTIVDNFGLVAVFYENAKSMSNIEVKGLKSCFFLGGGYSLWKDTLENSFAKGTSSMELAKDELDFTLSLVETFDLNEQSLFCEDLLKCIQSMQVFNKALLKHTFENLSNDLVATLNKTIDEKCAPTVEAVLSGKSYNWAKSARPLFNLVDDLTLIVNAKKVFGLLSDRTLMGIIRSLYRPISIDKLEEIQQKYITTGLVDEETSEIPAMLKKSKISIFKDAATRKRVGAEGLRLFVELIEECNKEETAIPEFEVISFLKTGVFFQVDDVDIIDFKSLLIENLFKFSYNNDPEKIIDFMKRLNARTKGDLARYSFDHGLKRSAMTIVEDELDEETAEMIFNAVKADEQRRPETNESILKRYIKTLLS